MFIETLEFTIPVELCNVFSTLQKGQRSNVEFPASVNSYGTTQDASVQVVLRSNKLTFKVDGVSSNASMISKSECKTLKLSVFDVDRTLMPQENDNYDSNNMSAMQHSTPVSFPSKRHQEISVSQPPAKNRRTSFSESPRPRSPLHRRSQPQISPRPSQNTQSKSKNDSPVNVKQEPEDPDLIEIELDHDPDDVVPKKETPYMQIDYSSDVPHTQTSQAALDRLSHPQSSHSQSPGSSSSSFHQNVPHVPDYAEPSTSQVHHGDQSADDFLVFQEQDEDCDDNDADYGNDERDSEDVTQEQDLLYCRSCSFFTISQHDLHQHMASHAAGDAGVFSCDSCNQTFTTQHRYYLHLVQQHDYRGQFECAHCGLQSATFDEHQRHVDNHAHELFLGSASFLQCPNCFKHFSRKHTLQHHMRNCGLPTDLHKAFLCNMCNTNFSSKRALNTHVNGMHKNKLYVCGVCGERFRWRAALRNHRLKSPACQVKKAQNS
ncbi:zinc finger and BTB domain-containing protein 14-like isoform X3 [Haliotis rufescens]|uniref:zinc finger and BTB domain-containing protein 14-like isoform X3 n=1 Tax=Haliotis rufescens TaxID=6454 RepID=UPI00201F7CDD|nr:zinc finger and BTB domain-containing protein 14-like isoform X3 [Haliotis rufescens]